MVNKNMKIEENSIKINIKYLAYGDEEPTRAFMCNEYNLYKIINTIHVLINDNIV